VLMVPTTAAHSLHFSVISSPANSGTIEPAQFTPAVLCGITGKLNRKLNSAGTPSS
jgi:hypothetical protein